MYTIEWDASMLVGLAVSHWIMDYERDSRTTRKELRHESEVEVDGERYWLMCEVTMAEREHRAVSMICGIEPRYSDAPVRVVGNMGMAIGNALPMLSNFLAGYGVIYM